jgi:hypothetical protein
VRQPEARLKVPVADARILDLWASYYYSHQWERLQAEARDALEKVNAIPRPPAVEGCPKPGDHTFDFATNTYRIVFVSQAQNPAGEVINFQISPIERDPYAARLPGVEKFFDVFLDYSGDGKLRSSFTSSATANPVVEALPGFVKQIPLTGLANFVHLQQQGFELQANANLADIRKWRWSDADRPKPGAIYVSVGKVELPFDRGTVAIGDEAVIPPSPVTFDAAESTKFLTSAAELRDHIVVREAGGSACAQYVARCLYDAVAVEIGNPSLTLQEASADCPNGAWIQHQVPPSDSCGRFTEPKPDIAECYEAVSDGESKRCLAAHRISEVYGSVTRANSACVSGGRLDFEAATDVEKAFLELTAGDVVKAKRDSVYENFEQQRLSLGLIAAVIVDRSGDPRVKVDSGKISADPVSGTLTMATVNFHPLGFDPKSMEPSRGERFRLFAGATLTPEFGLGGGVGYGIIRGLSVNLGYAWLRVDALKHSDRVEQAPSNSKDPFENGFSRVVFIGFGYSL